MNEYIHDNDVSNGAIRWAMMMAREKVFRLIDEICEEHYDDNGVYRTNERQLDTRIDGRSRRVMPAA